MKVIVTHLKAPWPVGTQVGGAVDFDGDSVPAWALGKCRPAEGVAATEPSVTAAADKQHAEEVAAASKRAKR